MSNQQYGPYGDGSGHNPFTQGRYQHPHQSPYGDQPPYGQDPYQSSYQRPNPFDNRQVAPYRRGGSPDLQQFQTSNAINHWGSAFFPILSVVMFFIEKGKNPVYDKHLRETMNMGLTRIVLGAAAGLASGWMAALLGVASFVYFVLALTGAYENTQLFPKGSTKPYKGAIPFTRKDD